MFMISPFSMSFLNFILRNVKSTYLFSQKLYRLANYLTLDLGELSL